MMPRCLVTPPRLLAIIVASRMQAVHFDKSLDSYKKAEELSSRDSPSQHSFNFHQLSCFGGYMQLACQDVVMEAFLMARGCHGLLSTCAR